MILNKAYIITKDVEIQRIDSNALWKDTLKPNKPRFSYLIPKRTVCYIRDYSISYGVNSKSSMNKFTIVVNEDLYYMYYLEVYNIVLGDLFIPYDATAELLYGPS